MHDLATIQKLNAQAHTVTNELIVRVRDKLNWYGNFDVPARVAASPRRMYRLLKFKYPALPDTVAKQISSRVEIAVEIAEAMRSGSIEYGFVKTKTTQYVIYPVSA